MQKGSPLSRMSSTRSLACSRPSSGGGWGPAIAAEGEDVLDPFVVEALEQLDELGARVADAGEVGHHLGAEDAPDARDDLDGQVAVAAARAIGDRDEAGVERREVGDRPEKLVHRRVGLGWKELEGEAGLGLIEPIADAHGAIP
jgi:hypothetical protein